MTAFVLSGPVGGRSFEIAQCRWPGRARLAWHAVAVVATRTGMSVCNLDMDRGAAQGNATPRARAAGPDGFYERLLLLEEAVRELHHDGRRRAAVALAVERLRRLVGRRGSRKDAAALSEQVTLDDALARIGGPR